MYSSEWMLQIIDSCSHESLQFYKAFKALPRQGLPYIFGPFEWSPWGPWSRTWFARACTCTLESDLIA